MYAGGGLTGMDGMGYDVFEVQTFSLSSIPSIESIPRGCRMTAPGLFREYVRELNRSLSQGNATEHTHRPALKTLLKRLAAGHVVATNEPARAAFGAPDYGVYRNALTVGYIEAKDVGVSIRDIEIDGMRANPTTPNGAQFRRYRENIDNLILTNYAEFRWYVDGKRRLSATLADDDGSGRLTASGEGIADTANLLSAFFEQSPQAVSKA